MKKTIIILAIIITILSINKEEKVIIPKDSIRFRVVANSNQKEDQELKKKIVLNLKNNISELNFKRKDIQDSRNKIKQELPTFEQIVKNTLIEEQTEETYQINYGKNYFPQKEYRGVIYEEGEYESLVITLGKGEGDNFWCVLFPPLCLLEVEEEDSKNIEYTSFIKEVVDKYF